MVRSNGLRFAGVQSDVPCRPYYPPQDRNFPINIVTATVTVNAHHSLITRFLPGRGSAVVVLRQLTVDATRKHCHRTLVLGGQGDALAFTDGTETTVPLSPSSYGTGPEHVLASLARRGPCAPAGAPRTRPDAVPAGRRSRLVAGGPWPRRARDDRRQGPRGEQGGLHMDAEHRRLEETRSKAAPWRKWGPYLTERQWGTVREDYSDSGNAWDYFTHDQARSRAYRWGEDGLAGISDDRQLLCFALALWNGKDPILKERLFGLTNSEANHGEDVKEYYFYLDSTPTHSYMKYLYKYPQRAYPYDQIVTTNRHRRRNELEYELLDTGVFDENRYFDVFVEYAKAAPRTFWSASPSPI